MRRMVLAALICFVSVPVFGQVDLSYRSATVEGTPGLFKTWDAEPIRPGEVYFSTGAVRTHRDPGQLTITSLPVGLAIGLFNRLEVFGMGEAQKRIDAGNIQYYRVAPGEPPRAATTPLGEQYFSTAAPFIDVPRATGRGEVYGRVKFNVFSQQERHPFAVSVVALGKAASQKNFTGLNRGLATGDVEVGFGGLVSKRLNNQAQVHGNVLFVWTGHPTIHDIGIIDLDNCTVVRAGASFPLRSHFEGIAEFESIQYHFWSHSIGLNPVNPLDVTTGVRYHANRTVSFSAGYLASVRHIADDPARAVHPAATNGFTFQLSLAFRPE